MIFVHLAEHEVQQQETQVVSAVCLPLRLLIKRDVSLAGISMDEDHVRNDPFEFSGCPADGLSDCEQHRYESLVAAVMRMPNLAMDAQPSCYERLIYDCVALNPRVTARKGLQKSQIAAWKL